MPLMLRSRRLRGRVWGVAMSNERALLWLIVIALMGAGFLLGQTMSISIAAVVALYVIYQQMSGDMAKAAA